MSLNPDRMTEFLIRLRIERDKDYTVFVDLSEIEERKFDAIAVPSRGSMST